MQYLGVIEGFYGKSYSPKERAALLSFMQQHKLSFYIYAPKEEIHLRDHWQSPLSKNFCDHLSSMHSACLSLGLDFGVALSPLNLTAHYDENHDLLLERVADLCSASSCEIFCLLFDDMDKSSEDVGLLQNKIIREVEASLPAHVQHFIVCPSYYSDDAILDRLFGQRPAQYFSELTQDLPERVEIFWTGDRILSKDITADYLSGITKLLGRKPFLWDNYPVNDGKAIHHYLYLKPFFGRRHLHDHITGHAINPMVQCALSTLPELTLPLIYEDKSDAEIQQAYEDYARSIFGKAADRLLDARILDLLSVQGDEHWTEADRKELLEIADLDTTPALEELKDFLQGSKRFDQRIVLGQTKLP